jgi:hypothetical protein
MLSVIVLSVVAPYLEALKFYLIKLATDFFDKQPIDWVSSSKIKLFYTLQKILYQGSLVKGEVAVQLTSLYQLV